MGALVVVLEFLSSGHPLDVRGTAPEALGCTVGLFALLAAVDLRLLLILWPVLAWTEGAHAAAGSPLVWGLGALPFAVLALWAPRVAVAASPLLGLVVPLARPGALPTTVEARAGDRPGVLLITVDTIRTDARLLEQAIVDPSGRWELTTATTAAPWTPPAMTSLWLGLPVEAHGGGIELNKRITWPRGAGFADAFASHWQQAGRRAEGIASNPYLRAEAGFSTGFDAFWHSSNSREPHLLVHVLRASFARLTGHDSRVGLTRDARVTAFAVERLKSDTADLVWVHLLEPHEYRRRRGAPRQAYAACVRQTAQRLQQLIAAAGDRTIIIVGDHGESLGEDGIWGHGRHLRPEVLEVPLAIRWPTATPKTRWNIPRVGVLIRSLALHSRPPATGSGPVPVSGVRGADALTRWHWSPDSQVATAQAGLVEPGPVQPLPDASTYAALEALGYMDH